MKKVEIKDLVIGNIYYAQESKEDSTRMKFIGCTKSEFQFKPLTKTHNYNEYPNGNIGFYRPTQPFYEY